MARNLLTLLLFCMSLTVGAQDIKTQYFDGADTVYNESVTVTFDTAANNIWQIGPPQKLIFDSAFSEPNVLVTDTINYYPVGANSSFTIYSPHMQWFWGIFAIRWMQKLDMDSAFDGGIIEFSLDTGNTWMNVFNSPYVYNFYGFDTANADSLVTGELAFTGTDSLWRDIWLCFDYSFLSSMDSVLIRFTFKSDSIDNQKEGWMIDNMRMHFTIIHTVAKTEEQATRMKVYPTNTTGRVHIEGEKIPEYYVIKNMQLISADGRIVKEYGLSPVKFYIDIDDQPDGLYYLKVNTNKHSETYPIMLKR